MKCGLAEDVTYATLHVPSRSEKILFVPRIQGGLGSCQSFITNPTWIAVEALLNALIPRGMAQQLHVYRCSRSPCHTDRRDCPYKKRSAVPCRGILDIVSVVMLRGSGGPFQPERDVALPELSLRVQQVFLVQQTTGGVQYVGEGD
jgi:hypothetical protein